MNVKNTLLLLATCLLFSAGLFSTSLKAADDAAGDNANKTLVWPDGTRYVGEVKDGKRWGKGTIFWQDGTRFVGNFVNDQRNGPGTMILPDGTVYNGYFENDTLVEKPSGTAQSGRVASSEPAAPVAEVPADTTAAVDSAPAQIAQAPATEPAPAAVVAAAEPEAAQPMADNAITELTPAVREEVQEMVDLWAAAWSEQNVVQYLAYYSEEFDVPGRQSRRQWEALRRSRLTRPASINIGVAFEKLELTAPDTVEVQFNQRYRSNLYSDSTRKQLVVRKEGQFWRILSESSL